VLLLLCSCRTPPALSPADLTAPGWAVSRGQAVWRSNRQSTEIAGELLVASHSTGRTLVEFTKTPLPILIAQTTSEHWRLELVMENRQYGGRMPAPARALWVHLAACLRGSVPPGGVRFSRLDDSRWRLENTVSGEVIEGYLAAAP